MQRGIQSFVRRNGRITPGQKKALEHNLGKYEIIVKEDNTLDFDIIFGNHNSIILDIGFGNGDDLFNNARSFPELNFIGVEVYLSGIGALLNKVHAENLTNVRVINFDAVKLLTNNILENSIARVQLLFPDPWPKKRQAKRRIIQLPFIDKVYQALVKEGIFHVATDCMDYAEHIDGVLTTFDKLKVCDAEKQGIHFQRETTKFEKRGLDRGHAICDFNYIKK